MLVGFRVFGLVGALSEIFLTNGTLFQEFRAARVGLWSECSCTIAVTAFFLSAAGTAILSRPVQFKNIPVLVCNPLESRPGPWRMQNPKGCKKRALPAACSP